MPTNVQRYDATARFLHWTVAALIIAQYVLAELAEAAADNERLPTQLTLLANHKSLGITIVGLALLRVLWRITHQPPTLPDPMPGWQQTLAKLVHLLLYSLIFMLPVTGWLMSSASAYSVSWFGLLTLPDLIGPSTTVKEQWMQIHHLLAEGLLILVAVHVLAALKHQFIDRDRLLQRMFSGGILAIAAVLLVASVWLLGSPALAPVSAAQAIAAPAQTQLPAPVAAVPTKGTTAPSRWNIDYRRSEIRFAAEQAGAAFSGIWQKWEADIHFDANRLADSSARVQVAADSANTKDSDRDSTLTAPEWFAAATYPQVLFQAQQFRKANESDPPGYELVALGELRIKDHSAPVRLYFNVTTDKGNRMLTGMAQLDRLALHVGTGDWADISSVGQFVTVEVTVVASDSEEQAPN